MKTLPTQHLLDVLSHLATMKFFDGIADKATVFDKLYVQAFGEGVLQKFPRWPSVTVFMASDNGANAIEVVLKP